MAKKSCDCDYHVCGACWPKPGNCSKPASVTVQFTGHRERLCRACADDAIRAFGVYEVAPATREQRHEL